MRIVYCLNSIRTLGGIQKVTVQKANALAEYPENEVIVVVTDNSMEHTLTVELSPKVKFINLNINYYAFDYKSKLHVLFSYLKIFKHWKKLQQVVNRIKPDVIISTGQCEKYIIPLLKTQALKIREIHSSSNYRNYYYSNKFVAACLNFLDYRVAAYGYHKIVLLTQADKDQFFKDKDKYIVIPNPLAVPTDCSHVPSRKNRVISVGRIEKVKDFTALINSWAKVCQKVQDWELYIIGEGSERKILEKQISDMHLLGKVFLPGYSNKVGELLREASIFAFTSKFEGFSLAIIEAMNAGLPVVAFDCQFGPRDIITDGKDGYLIENRDEQAMAERIVSLIENSEKRNQMSEEAVKRADDFSIPVIMSRWMDLFHKEIDYLHSN